MGNALSLARQGVNQSIFIPAATLTEKNLPDQDRKVFLITGANSGVGYELARILYSRHGTVYLACRSAARANAAMSSIRSACPQSRGTLVFLALDLSDLSSIKPAVQEFLSKETRLDWLNHNAAVSMPDPKLKSAQGHDLTFTTNVLGPFLLTQLLLPVLQATARQLPSDEEGTVRVSWAGSIVVEVMSPRGGVGFNDSDGAPKDYGMNVYAVSKTANLFLCHEFAQRTAADLVLHNCYNPGNLKSNLLGTVRKDMWYFPLPFWLLDAFVLYPAVLGAYTELYAGLSKDLSLVGDQACYIVPWGQKVGRGHLRGDLMENIGEGKGSDKLWDWCERETSSFM